MLFVFEFLALASLTASATNHNISFDGFCDGVLVTRREWIGDPCASDMAYYCGRGLA
jgi:hypothetical protein